MPTYECKQIQRWLYCTVCPEGPKKKFGIDNSGQPATKSWPNNSFQFDQQDENLHAYCKKLGHTLEHCMGPHLYALATNKGTACWAQIGTVKLDLLWIKWQQGPSFKYWKLKQFFCGGTGTYTLYQTDQHCTGTDYYGYSNGQQFCEYWFISDAIGRYIYRQWQIVSAGWLTVRMESWSVWPSPGPMYGGGWGTREKP